jgi:tetratricopeptide (TPR) repeat protein
VRPRSGKEGNRAHACRYDPAVLRSTRRSAAPRLRLTAALVVLPGALALQEGTEVLPGEPFERLDASVRVALAALDPARAGWDDEVRAAALEAQLARLARHLEDPAADPAALAELFTEDFAFHTLELARVDETSGLVVRRPAKTRSSSPRDGGRDFFLAELARWVEDAHGVRARFTLVGNESTPEAFVFPAALRLDGVRGEGRLQLQTTWQCRWRADPGGKTPPRLQGVEVLQLEEIVARAGAPLFADASAGLFGANAAWQDELVPSYSEWRARLDTRLGLPLAGDAAGLAVGDVDGDGLEDLYLCQPGGLPNKLFRHLPDGTTQDISAEAGVDFLDLSRAALLVDLDNDGDRDLVVGTAERLLLLANDGRARFWLQGALAAPDASSLAAADVDVDGDLDLFACAFASPLDHGPLPVPLHAAGDGRPSLLFENQGDWIFSDAGAARGLERRRPSRAAAFEDVDLDGDPDLYVAGAFGGSSLYRNEAGRFVEATAEAGLEPEGLGTGVTWGDADGDGSFDLFVSQAGSSAGGRIASEERFLAGARAEERALHARLARGGSFWRNDGGHFAERQGGGAQDPDADHATRGALFADLDGDGWQDLLAPGGGWTQELPDLDGFFWREVVGRSPLAPSAPEALLAPYRAAWAALGISLRRGHSWAGGTTGRAYLSLDGRGFAEVSLVCAFALASDVRASALCDWDGDGDLDVFLTGPGSPRVRFLRNDQACGHASVTLELAGTRANRDAIGARVVLTLADAKGDMRRLMRGVRAGEGCLAQSSARLVIGLGTGVTLQRVRVSWPGGEAEDFRGVEPGKAWRLVQGRGQAEALALARAPAFASAPTKPAAPAAGSEPPLVRVPLLRPVPLPRLELVTGDGATLPLFGLQAGGQGTGTGKPILLTLFASTSAAAARELTDLARRAEELTQAGLAPLALALDPPEARARAADFLGACGWPYPWASATPEALARLEGVAALLLDTERRLSLPASFLVDARGALRVLYLGPLEPEGLRADLALCELGEGALFDAAVPFAGRWMFPSLPEDADFFEGRLRARGLEEAAREFARGRLAVVRTAPADLLQEFGRRSALEGRLDEAGEFFRRALAADPRHFGALFDWAVVLHRQERLSAAAELYGKALALQPEHADARFNLALVRLGLGDRAGAERELRWLRAHDVPGLEELERLLAEPR